MKRPAIAMFVLALVAACGTRAFATPVTLQPPVWSGNGANVGVGWTSQTANGTGFVTFDDFGYGAATTVNHATWFGIYLNADFTDGAPNTSRWDILINDDTGPGGTPGNRIGGLLNAPTVRTTLGSGFFGNNAVTVYEFDADFTPFTAAAATKYWFAPVSVGVLGNFAPFFSWIEGTGGDGSSVQIELTNFVPTNEFVRDTDRAFTLEAVPEPSTLVLLGLGLGSAVARRRRS